MLHKTVTNDNSKSKFYEILFVVYTIITIAIYTLPLTKFLLPYILVAIIMLISLPVLMLADKSIMNYGALLGAVSFFLIILYYAAGESVTGAINEGIRNLRFFIPIVWGIFALRVCNRKTCKWILLILGILLAYILITTIVTLELNPWIARELAQGKGSSSDEINAYRLRNVGGFEFSYMMGIITLCIVWTALTARKAWIKIICVAATVLCFYYIIQTMYTTLLIFTAIGTLILLIIKIKNPIIKLFMVLIGIFLLLFTGNIVELVAGMFPDGSFLNAKFMSIYNAIVNEDLSEMGGRPDLILGGLERWSQNPIFGKITEESDNHSMMISMLENAGIVGFGMWIGVFVASFFAMKNQLKKYGLDIKLFIVVFLYTFFLSFFNPIGYVFEITIAAFFIVPVWTKFISLTEDKHEKNISTNL